MNNYIKRNSKLLISALAIGIAGVICILFGASALIILGGSVGLFVALNDSNVECCKEKEVTGFEVSKTKKKK